MRIIVLLLLFYMSLFARTYDEIVSSNVLKIAMRSNNLTYHIEDQKVVSGFMYDLAKEFSKFLGVRLEIVHVENFKDFWLKDDKYIFALNPPATPDIYKKADCSLDLISINDRRKKYVDMIPFMKNKTMIFSHKNADIKNFQDLIGKKFLMFKGMQSEYILKSRLKSIGIKYKVFECQYSEKLKQLVFCEDFNPCKDGVNILLIDPKKQIPFLYFYIAIYQEEVDASLTDAFSLFEKLYRYEYLKDDLYPSFALDKEMGYLSGVFAKDTPVLKDKFEQFVKEVYKNGFMDSLMIKYLNINLKTYDEILEYYEN